MNYAISHFINCHKMQRHERLSDRGQHIYRKPQLWTLRLNLPSAIVTELSINSRYRTAATRLDLPGPRPSPARIQPLTRTARRRDLGSL